MHATLSNDRPRQCSLHHSVPVNTSALSSSACQHRMHPHATHDHSGRHISQRLTRVQSQCPQSRHTLCLALQLQLLSRFHFTSWTSARYWMSSLITRKINRKIIIIFPKVTILLFLTDEMRLSKTGAGYLEDLCRLERIQRRWTKHNDELRDSVTVWTFTRLSGRFPCYPA